MRSLSLALVFGLVAAPALARAQTVEGLDPHVKATVETSPPKITLTWNTNTDVTAWSVRRRLGTAGGFTTVKSMIPAATTTYEDTTVETGKTYEYQVTRQGAMSSGSSWTLAGMEVPFIDDPGVVALVVDSSMKSLSQIARLQDDLEHEGWDVEIVEVDPASKPPDVRQKLQELQKKHTTRLRAAFLLGGVPRAFSGALNPDGHPDHLGAWPSDGYYADLDGKWTDDAELGGTSVHANHKGDGQFDQNTIPSDLDIALGRVDTMGMPAFAPATPSDLLARYLDANHAYRTGAKQIKERSYVSDNFGYFSGEAFARIAYRDSWAIYGADPTKDKPFFDALEEEGGYAFAFGCGGGTPTGAGGVGSTTDFVTRKPQAVFLGLFGSYFGDWSYDNDFLRAALLSNGMALATAWFARPWHHLHHLGALETIGESYKTMANARGSIYDQGTAGRSVHMGLLGDPTLRIFVAKAPGALTAKGDGGSVSLTWGASADATAGYHVYRKPKTGGAATRVTMTPVMGTSYVDPVGEASVYRVVSVRLRTTGSGTFFEHSPGVMAEATALPKPAGDDAGTGDDAAVDPGATPEGESPSSSGCGCRTAGGSTSPWALAGLALLFRRRRVSSGRAAR